MACYLPALGNDINAYKVRGKMFKNSICLIPLELIIRSKQIRYHTDPYDLYNSLNILLYRYIHFVKSSQGQSDIENFTPKNFG